MHSDEPRQRLAACVSEGAVIVGMDLRFYDELPALFPHTDARRWFVDQPALVESTAFRNSSLQGAYLIIAARALALDCAP